MFRLASRTLPLRHLSRSVNTTFKHSAVRCISSNPMYCRDPSELNQRNAQQEDLVDQFLVNPVTGFLPRKDPVFELPAVFAPLENILNEMPLTKEDGTPGLLAKEKFGEASAMVPDFTAEIEKINDTGIISALFRDYTFWASAYLLEPCHHNMLRAGDSHSFGHGRNVLPLNISSPLLLLAEKLNVKPFMEYALSYALYNWKRIDPQNPSMDIENLKLIRSFSGTPSETGFVLVHIIMVAYTGKLVSSALNILESCHMKDRVTFNNNLQAYQEVLNTINSRMETMWQHSKPSDYKEFRTFIMGTKDQPMFPNGVYYERRHPVTKEVEKLGPYAYRGESGANDSIIPLSDNLCQLTEQMPSNPLTEILRDFRTYRPVKHNEFLSYIQETSHQLNLRSFAFDNTKSSFLYLTILDEIRDFRNRHWMFTKEYILKRTEHPVATGGSPIVTWLPNQLSTVLNVMQETVDRINGNELDEKDREVYEKIRGTIGTQIRVLQREVETLRAKFHQ